MGRNSETFKYYQNLDMFATVESRLVEPRFQTAARRVLLGKGSEREMAAVETV